MIKERLRLDEIERLLSEYYNTEDVFEQTDLSISIIQGHVDWLIEQVERVSKQETRINNLTFELAVSRTQNERYREALRFYADEKNYEDIGIPTGNNPPALPILEDRGQVARKALEGEE